MKKRKPFSLPEQLSKDWRIHSTLSFDKTHSVFVLTGYRQNKKCILKYLAKNNLSYKKLRILSHIPNKYLLTPKKHFHVLGEDYILYTKEETLRELLYNTGISLQELLSIGIDLTHAIEALIQAGCYEADISPNNIYYRSNGIFCLGDLNIEKRKIRGTPPYLAPEMTKERKKFLKRKSITKQFDHAMQYSICSLLDSLCSLQREFYFEELRKALQIGMHENPEQRYNSLAELRKALSDLSDNHIEQPDQLLILHEQNHFLFRVKTVPMKNNISPLPNVFIWCSLVLAGIFLIFSLHSHLKPTQTTDMGIASSKIADSTNSKMPDSTNTEIPNSTNTVFITEIPFTPTITTPAAIKNSKALELDIQKKGLYSLSTVTKTTQNPSNYSCLYAGGNLFTNLQTISDFSRLRELYADNNQLQDIAELSNCNDLEILVLSYNNIQDISALTKLPKLCHLDLSSNRHFADIQSLKKMTNLRILNISNTLVSKKQYRQLCKKLPDCQIIY